MSSAPTVEYEFSSSNRWELERLIRTMIEVTRDEIIGCTGELPDDDAITEISEHRKVLAHLYEMHGSVRMAKNEMSKPGTISIPLSLLESVVQATYRLLALEGEQLIALDDDFDIDEHDARVYSTYNIYRDLCHLEKVSEREMEAS